MNSIADELANAGIHIKDTIIINFNFFHNNSLGLIKWNNIYVIDQNDQNIRKWSNNITQPLIFNSMINNTEMARLANRSLVETLDFYQEWSNLNPLDTPIYDKLSKTQRSCLRKLNSIYPTAYIQQRNYLKLYPGHKLPCVECNSTTDNNTWVHKNSCVDITIRHKDILFNANIKDHAKGLVSSLIDAIKSSPFFDCFFRNILPITTHPFTFRYINRTYH